MQTIQGRIDMPWKNRPASNDFFAWYDWMVYEQSYSELVNMTTNEAIRLYQSMVKCVEYGDART